MAKMNKVMEDAINQLEGRNSGRVMRSRNSSGTGGNTIVTRDSRDDLGFKNRGDSHKKNGTNKKEQTQSTTPWSPPQGGDWHPTLGGNQTRDPGMINRPIDQKDRRRGETQHQRLYRIADELHKGKRDLDDLRKSVDRGAKKTKEGDNSENWWTEWTDYEGPSKGYTGVEGDEYYKNQGFEGYYERARQIFGNRGVLPETLEEGVIPASRDEYHSRHKR